MVKSIVYMKEDSICPDDEEIFNVTLENIRKLPERIRIGLSVIYPERKQEYVEYLLEKAKTSDCSFMDTALQIMLLLDSGASVEQASKLIHSDDENRERSMVFLFSKRGPEFFLQTSRVPFERMDCETRQSIRNKVLENDTFARRELTSRGIIKEKKFES